MGVALPSTRLEDGAVLLRPWENDDAPALARACQDPEIPRWTVVPSPYSETTARSWIELQAERRASGEAAELAVIDAASSRLTGAVGIVLTDRPHRRGEVGYWIAAEARGRGLATRAVRLIARWGFETLSLARIELLAHPDNHVSQRVAVAAGFREEGRLRSYREMKGERVDFLIFSMLPGDSSAP